MRDHMPIRTRMKSWRTAVAVAGVAAMAVTLGQSVSTLANPNDAVSTDGSQIATGNFFPTPLTAGVTCRTNPSGAPAWDRRAEISWDRVPEATGYVLELLVWNSDNPNTAIRQRFEVPATQLSVGGIVDEGKEQLYARVRTVNGPAVSSGYSTPVERISHKTWVNNRTECENRGHPGVPNPPWENTTVWNPASPAPSSAGQAAVMAAQRSAPAAELDQVEEDPAEVNAEAGEGDAGETRAPADDTTEAASPSSTPATARPTVAPRSSGTAAPSPSTSTRSVTTAKATTAPTSSRPSSSASPATTTTQPPNEPERLPGGGQAEIVDGTKLVVSGTGAPQCSVTVRRGSTLEVRAGVLEVADSVEVRAVNLESCELSKK